MHENGIFFGECNGELLLGKPLQGKRQLARQSCRNSDTERSKASKYISAPARSLYTKILSANLTPGLSTGSGSSEQELSVNSKSIRKQAQEGIEVRRDSCECSELAC